MKIACVNLFLNNRTNNIKTKNSEFFYVSPSTTGVLKPQKYDCVSFSAKIPKITDPTIDDLINNTPEEEVLRANILRLAKYDIPCPVCGHLMLAQEKFNTFESKVLSTTDTGELLKYIGEYRKYLHPVEAKVFNILKTLHKEYPDKSVYELLKSKLPEAECNLIREQSKIFTEIGILSRDFPPQKRDLIQGLIKDSYSRIWDTRETSRFSRKVFIDKLKSIFSSGEVKQNALSAVQYEIFNLTTPTLIEKTKYNDKEYEIIEQAVKLPKAQNNVNAFIVKYAKKNYGEADPSQKIAIRLLSSSLATIEHIKAQKNDGETVPGNLALECAADNNSRGHNDIIEQIIDNPAMPENYKKYMRRLCELHNEGILDKTYIKQQNKTFKNASMGILNAVNEIRELIWDGPNTPHKNTDDAPQKAESQKPSPGQKARNNGAKGYSRPHGTKH